MSTKSIAPIALLASVFLWLLLFIHHLLQSSYYGALISSIAIVCFQMVGPIEILKYYQIAPRTFNIFAQNLETIFDIFLPPYGEKRLHPDPRGIVRDILLFIKVSSITLIPYIVCYWIFFKWQAVSHGMDLLVSLKLPPKLLYETFTQIFAVALPEELFYRGFLQSALLQRWPNRHYFFGLPMGRAILITNAIFAVGHLIGSPSPARLLTFFPGIIFSYLIYKNNSLLPGVLFHALCNIVGQILYISIFLK